MQGRTEFDGYPCIIVHNFDTIPFPYFIPTKPMLTQLEVLWVGWRTKARENNRDATSDRL